MFTQTSVTPIIIGKHLQITTNGMLLIFQHADICTYECFFVVVKLSDHFDFFSNEYTLTLDRWDQRKNLKWLISSYFHSSSSPFSRPCGANFLTLWGTHKLLPNLTYPKLTHHPYVWKYKETHNFGFFPWPDSCFSSWFYTAPNIKIIKILKVCKFLFCTCGWLYRYLSVS